MRLAAYSGDIYCYNGISPGSLFRELAAFHIQAPIQTAGSPFMDCQLIMPPAMPEAVQRTKVVKNLDKSMLIPFWNRIEPRIKIRK